MNIGEVELEKELIPHNEATRIEALRNYAILDSPSEEMFRNLAETAALIFNASIGMISFIDSDRVFFKENYGGELTGRSIKRSHSLCSMVVLQDNPTVFKDLHSNPCHSINPSFIKQIGLGFYAGVPLKSKDGHNIGVIAIADYEARDFSEKDERILQNLGKMAMFEMELRLFSFTELHKLNSKVRAQYHELIFTQSELEKSQKELDNFLYRASHDLKGPLSTMAGLLNLAHQELTDTMALSYMEKLSIVSVNMNEALSKLVVIYSLLRENQSSNLHRTILNKSNLEEMLDLIFLNTKRKIDLKNIQVNIALEDVQFEANQQHVQLILSNCIENAVHFHKKIAGRKPIIDVEVKNTSNGVMLKISDNGEGIPTEHHDRIFELFFRGNNSARSGMGLYIVKKLVEKSGGAIHFNSEYGHFTEFIITLPTGE
ncbi:MAG: GAF domain-containing sensor histidine kinase [Chryseolinea sp.]